MNPLAAALSLAFAVPVPAQTCEAGPGEAVALVSVRGLRAPSGLLVVYLYGDDARAFLRHGRALQRIELPVTSAEPAPICLRAPRPGAYAISVRHDVDGDRRRLDMDDGGGFSRNPNLSFAHPRPALPDVLIALGPGVTPVELVMNYRFGLSVRPVSTP